MQQDKLKSLLGALASGSESLNTLKNNPDELKKKFDLDDDDIKALKSSDIVLKSRSPEMVITFGTGTSINSPADPEEPG